MSTRSALSLVGSALGLGRGLVFGYVSSVIADH